MDDVKHLRNLNDAQMAAVTSLPNIPLQILAGPGSGKTRTLTCRIAHLIHHHKTSPSKIVAVTFTNKAANELRIRLEGLIGKVDASLVVLGTFHAICGRLLRQHGSAISLPRNFSICDSDESKKLINAILKDMVANLGLHGSGKRIDVRDSVAVDLISKAKSKGLSPDDIEAKAHRDIASNVQRPKGDMDPHFMLQLCSVYAEYTKALRKNNALDFDDLLMFGVKLLKEKPSCIDYEHVFVDEFQDTNTTQLQLMTRFASRNGNVSVVGDPDQSIYGWRSAEIENLTRMIEIFPDTKQIYLEDNYRSTGAILAASIAIISEDTARPPKTLRTFHPNGIAATLGNCAEEHEEAACIAEEIKRLKMISGGLLKWSDFAILLRFNALSRNLETALQKEGIPNRVLSGQKFFDRTEVKDLLAYLQLVDNTNFDPAVLRVLNVPRRSIGDKSMEELRKRASKMGKSVMHVVERIVDGRIPDISPPIKSKAKAFVQTMRALRKKAVKGMSVAALIQELLTELNYAEHLQKSQQPDWESRWENVRELITFATESTPSVASATDPKEDATATEGEPVAEGPVAVAAETNSYFDDTESPPDTESLPNEELEATNPLRLFLQTTSLSTDTTTNDGDDQNEKVNISTCHAAKGLEWPVVFIPSAEKGTFPFYRSDDTDEERRLLYVACTRAQVLLYLTHAAKRKLGGESRTTELSEFIKAVLDKNKKLFTNDKPILGHAEFRVLSKVIGRPAPDATHVDQGVRDYYKLQAFPPAKTAVQMSVSDKGPRASSQNYFMNKSFQFKPVFTVPQQPRQGPMPPAVFTTARSVVNSLPQVQNLPSSQFKYGADSSHSSLPTTWLAGDAPVPANGSEIHGYRNSGLREVPRNVPKPDILSLHPGRTGQSGVLKSSPFMSQTLPVEPMPASNGLIASSGFTDTPPASASSYADPPAKLAGTKRRLGMSSRGADFPRKK